MKVLEFVTSCFDGGVVAKEVRRLAGRKGWEGWETSNAENGD